MNKNEKNTQIRPVGNGKYQITHPVLGDLGSDWRKRGNDYISPKGISYTVFTAEYDDNASQMAREDMRRRTVFSA